MNSKHKKYTPAPWGYFEPFYSGDRNRWVYCSTAHASHPALTLTQARTNGIILGKAPELYEALQNLALAESENARKTARQQALSLLGEIIKLIDTQTGQTK